MWHSSNQSADNFVCWPTSVNVTSSRLGKINKSTLEAPQQQQQQLLLLSLLLLLLYNLLELCRFYGAFVGVNLSETKHNIAI